MVWWRGYAGSVVECTFKTDEPLAEIISEEVAAISKISVSCASKYLIVFA